jgi:hypothetical protein
MFEQGNQPGHPAVRNGRSSSLFNGRLGIYHGAYPRRSQAMNPPADLPCRLLDASENGWISCRDLMRVLMLSVDPI